MPVPCTHPAAHRDAYPVRCPEVPKLKHLVPEFALGMDAAGKGVAEEGDNTDVTAEGTSTTLLEVAAGTLRFAAAESCRSFAFQLATL